MLKHMRLKADSSWEEAAEACRGEPEWGVLEGDEERRAVFQEFVEKLKVCAGVGVVCVGGGEEVVP
jgi:hypothetical protein